MEKHVDPGGVKRRALAQHALTEVDKVIEPLIAVVPPLGASLYLAKSFIGYAMVRRQEELNAYVEFIRDNPETFRQDIVESREFQDGFVSSLESYLKLRSETKRLLARQILLGFAAADDKQCFPLERLQDTLAKLSESSIAFIAFVESEIIPLRHQRIQKKAAEVNLEASDKPHEWWVAHYEKTEPISTDIGQYIFDNYHPSGAKSKEANGGDELEGEALSAAFEVEQAESERIYDAIGELTQLSVMARTVGGAGWGDGGAVKYSFTKFGKKFVEYVKASDFSSLLAA